jgi:hypothetical protein
MATRIRTVKPELYRHEGLFELEQETGWPMRIAFAGLFAIADREGRFEWKPKILKLDVLPHDEIDFERVLNAFASRGFLVKYKSNTGDPHKFYGWIRNFRVHQVINNKESQSKLPDPEKGCEIIEVAFARVTRDSRVAVAYPQLEILSQGELEGKGTGREQELEKNIATGSSSTTADPQGPSSTALAWRAYRDAYADRHGKPPLWNSKTAGMFKHFVSRVPAKEAPDIAAFYVKHNEFTYVRSMHPVGLLLRDAEKIRTEWATGTMVTQVAARSADRRQGTQSAFHELISKAESRERGESP